MYCGQPFCEFIGITVSKSVFGLLLSGGPVVIALEVLGGLGEIQMPGMRSPSRK